MAEERRPGRGIEISSPANPRIKQLIALRRRRAREQAGVTLVEGLAEGELALAAGVHPRALYYCPALTPPGSGDFIHRAAVSGAETYQLTRPVFEKISYREGPDGYLLVVPALDASLDDLDGALTRATAAATGARAGQPLILVCASLEKPGNLGAILRTADAAGVTAVIAADPVTDWGNPNVVRASKGTVFSVPVASAPSAEVLDWLAARAIKIVAATPAATQLTSDADLTGPTAIAVGAEQTGLGREWLDRADIQVRIPMFGRADSLNVATSAAIITYEAVRQRTLTGGETAPPKAAPPV